jgi:hypothetical protein
MAGPALDLPGCLAAVGKKFFEAALGYRQSEKFDLRIIGSHDARSVRMPNRIRRALSAVPGFGCV